MTDKVPDISDLDRVLKGLILFRRMWEPFGGFNTNLIQHIKWPDEFRVDDEVSANAIIAQLLEDGVIRETTQEEKDACSPLFTKNCKYAITLKGYNRYKTGGYLSMNRSFEDSQLSHLLAMENISRQTLESQENMKVATYFLAFGTIALAMLSIPQAIYYTGGILWGLMETYLKLFF